MGWRQRYISKSILIAIFHSPDNPSNKPPSLLACILAFFSTFQLTLSRYKAALFKKLRNDVWKIDEDEYKESFRSGKRKNGSGGLISKGDLGYSGSTFFATRNGKYLIKSLSRRFEQSFFRDRLLDPYTAHMSTYPTSLLVRITDLLCTPSPALGTLLGTTPSHHIVMENILSGQLSRPKPEQKKWETYDLKPNDYFYPERDVAGGVLVPESVKERLIDKFEDKVRVGIDEKEDLVSMLVQDTKILQEANALDYSLFLVRYPYSPEGEPVPQPPGLASPWRSGIVSRDKKWVYRAVLIDFFWVKDALQAKALTGLVDSWNFFQRGKGDGPMSITTTASEYRKRFLWMVEEIVEGRDSEEQVENEGRRLKRDITKDCA
ncbi:SAICAR synthase-like protein [Lepidopterella palustris CBS 459.81]|uniref:SAICAR synthase-like protein n=1 Tax=Lepidopterella palustris CBS 459.81 TaxID=1314670 RepID=A0A8E2EJZ7_9PEZI|nr:SAICAR synthase-like protein [Lepidopterella palustris CBS 459.81]